MIYSAKSTHATSLTMSAFGLTPPPPLGADVLYEWSPMRTFHSSRVPPPLWTRPSVRPSWQRGRSAVRKIMATITQRSCERADLARLETASLLLCRFVILCSGRPKEEFCHSAESRKRAFQRYSFLPKYRKNRKRVFLQKWHLSAEIGSFCRSRALWNEEFCIT